MKDTLAEAIMMYPNIPHNECLSALGKRLHEKDDKDIFNDNTLLKLAELVLKSNIFCFNEKTISFMAEL